MGRSCASLPDQIVLKSFRIADESISVVKLFCLLYIISWRNWNYFTLKSVSYTEISFEWNNIMCILPTQPSFPFMFSSENKNLFPIAKNFICTCSLLDFNYIMDV